MLNGSAQDTSRCALEPFPFPAHIPVISHAPVLAEGAAKGLRDAPQGPSSLRYHSTPTRRSRAMFPQGATLPANTILHFLVVDPKVRPTRYRPACSQGSCVHLVGAGEDNRLCLHGAAWLPPAQSHRSN